MYPTHVRIKTETKVNVERYEGGVLVVRNLKGKILGSYEREQMKKFHERYRSLAVARGGKRRGS